MKQLLWKLCELLKVDRVKTDKKNKTNCLIVSLLMTEAQKSKKKNQTHEISSKEQLTSQPRHNTEKAEKNCLHFVFQMFNHLSEKIILHHLVDESATCYRSSSNTLPLYNSYNIYVEVDFC